MSYNISIHKVCSSYTGLDTFSNQVFTLQDKQEYEQVLQLCRDKKNMAGLFKASIIPIRTTFSSLSTDLFLPTLIHGVIKTENASKVCFILLALLWDTVSLPIRLITLLPRVCYNAFAQSKEHPLIPYLKGKGLDSFNVEGEIVIRVYEETIEDGRCKQNGFRHKLFLTNHEVPFSIDAYQFGSWGPNNPNDQPIHEASLDITPFLAKAKSYAETQTYGESGNLLSYITKILNDPQFQTDPENFMKNWKQKRGDTEEFRIPEDQAMIFLEKEVLPQLHL